jgi:hypothetical protein
MARSGDGKGITKDRRRGTLGSYETYLYNNPLSRIF